MTDHPSPDSDDLAALPDSARRVALLLRETGHATKPVTLIDADLLELDSLWAAAGHPHAVFNLTAQELIALTGAPVVDVALRETA